MPKKFLVYVPLPEPINYNSLCYCCYQKVEFRIKVLVGIYIYEYDVCPNCAKKYNKKKCPYGLTRKPIKRIHYSYLVRKNRKKKKYKHKKKRRTYGCDDYEILKNFVVPIYELHKELINFKESINFIREGFSNKKTKYYKWFHKVKNLDNKLNRNYLVLKKLNVSVFDLILLGEEYKKTRGNNNSYILFLNKRFYVLYKRYENKLRSYYARHYSAN